MTWFSEANALACFNCFFEVFYFFNLKANKRLTKLVTIPTEHKATLDTAQALDGWATQTTLLSVDEKGVVDEAELIAQLEKQQCDLLTGFFNLIRLAE